MVEDAVDEVFTFPERMAEAFRHTPFLSSPGFPEHGVLGPSIFVESKIDEWSCSCRPNNSHCSDRI